MRVNSQMEQINLKYRFTRKKRVFSMIESAHFTLAELNKKRKLCQSTHEFEAIEHKSNVQESTQSEYTKIVSSAIVAELSCPICL